MYSLSFNLLTIYSFIHLFIYLHCTYLFFFSIGLNAQAMNFELDQQKNVNIPTSALQGECAKLAQKKKDHACRL